MYRKGLSFTEALFIILSTYGGNVDILSYEGKCMPIVLMLLDVRKLDMCHDLVFDTHEVRVQQAQ